MAEPPCVDVERAAQHVEDAGPACCLLRGECSKTDALRPGAYAQHYDKDVVIPDDVARPCLVSAQAFLALAVVSFFRGFVGLAGVAVVLYATSVNHWRRPRMTSWRHFADLAAVTATAAYGSYLATTRARTPAWTVAWYAGLAAIFALFAANEATYYLQVLDAASRRYTEPGTPSRDAAYRRATWTHVVGVHLSAATLAFLFVARGLRRRPP